MRADVGDSLVVKGATNGDPDQRGIITECAHGRRHAALHGSLARTGHLALVYGTRSLSVSGVGTPWQIRDWCGRLSMFRRDRIDCSRPTRVRAHATDMLAH